MRCGCSGSSWSPRSVSGALVSSVHPSDTPCQEHCSRSCARMSGVSPSRADRRQDVTARILEIARRHLAEEGAASLSLRAVTRELGMVSSAVYRYVANRDELLTLLVVDAYTDLADAVDRAVAADARKGWQQRVVTGCLAFRAWAVADPARYALLYGSPVPGYTAPAERTTEPGTRVVLLLARPGHRGRRARRGHARHRRPARSPAARHRPGPRRRGGRDPRRAGGHRCAPSTCGRPSSGPSASRCSASTVRRAHPSPRPSSSTRSGSSCAA